jgi:hypothetical protein
MPKNGGGNGGRMAGGGEVAKGLEPGFYKGIRERGKELVRVRMTKQEINGLHDPIARLILAKGLRPLDLPASSRSWTTTMARPTTSRCARSTWRVRVVSCQQAGACRAGCASS